MSKIFSGINELPNGTASDKVTPGCMVLEGGAFRSLYGEGVLDALMEADINLECVIGVSAGALNGTTYLSGQIGRAARINMRYRNDSRYVSWPRIFQNGGPLNFDFIFYHVPDDPFDEERFFRPGRRYLAVATDCRTGKPVCFDRDTCGNIYTAIQASSSMPYMSRIVLVDGIPCLDGGCSVKIPYRWALKQDFSKIVIVRNRPSDWRYEDVKPSRLARQFYRPYPRFAKVLSTSNARFNRECDEIDQLEREGRVFVIAPSESMEIKKLEPDMERLGAWYYLGYEDGKNAIGDLRQYLGTAE